MTAVALPTAAKALIQSTDMVALLAQIRAARRITIFAKTTPDLIPGNPFGTDIRKVSRVHGMVLTNYDNIVNNQRKREGKPADFVPAPRPWGTRITDTCFIVHTPKPKRKGDVTFPKMYVEIYVTNAMGHEYQREDGTPISEDEVKPWLRPESEGRQGLEEKRIIRTYEIKNVIGFKFGKTVYAVQDNLTLLQDLVAVR